MTADSPNSSADAINIVTAYHDRTKHHWQRYARSLGFLDWANQPDPFRSYDGCERLALDRTELQLQPSYDELFSNAPLPTAEWNRASVSRFFMHCLALSAWKQASPSNIWSLRINPSSGALHPTEGYLLSGPIPELTDRPGIFHYMPLHHALERRCELSRDEWQQLSAGLPPGCVLMGLTSIYWREAWKYGERAFRYCQHDVGHALGTIAFAARLLGWESRLLTSLPDRDLNILLGTHCHSGPEAEHADCLLALWPQAVRRLRFHRDPDATDMRLRVAMESQPTDAELLTRSVSEGLTSLVDALRDPQRWIGQPNQLSDEHHPWPIIDDVALTIAHAQNEAPVNDVTSMSGLDRATSTAHPQSVSPSAEQIIRQRRSAVDMDGVTTMERETFFRLLLRTVPLFAADGTTGTAGTNESQMVNTPNKELGETITFPWAMWPSEPRVSLALFVHRVNDLEPGLYLLARSAAHEQDLKARLRDSFTWQRPSECPDELRLFLLQPADTRDAARSICCHQDIASDGIFAVGMLTQFEAPLTQHGSGIYPRLFWETGLIGQVLYLEAEAAGVRGTGIGCFFDDAMHQVLGINDHSWQSLYHFTIGGPVVDVRLKTLEPYQPALTNPKR